MIVVAGTMTIDADYHEAMVVAAQKATDATRQEPGCLSYEFFADLTDPGRFHMFEEWESVEALETHLGTEHIKTFGAALRSFGISSSNVYRYDASNKTQIG